MSEKDAARELRQHRDDPDEWSEEAEEIEVRPRRSSMVSFRLPAEDFDALERAMEQTGESLSEYVRKAIDLRMRGGAIVAPMGTVGVTYGSTFGDPAEVDAGQFLTGHIAEALGIRVVEGGSTSASHRPRRSRPERFTVLN